MKAKAKAAPARNQRVSSRKQRKQQHLLDVKVRSRAANRQRNRRVLAWFSGLFLFCAAVGGIGYGGREALRRFFWQNPDYSLVEVAIHTDGSLTRDQIIAATDIHEGKNIFAINLSAARKGLMALPQVERAEIERILPNKLSIDIAERKPVAWVTGKDDDNPSADPGAFLIDRDGVLLRVKSQVPEYYHLPVICGMDVENPARYQVRSIDVSKGYCMIVTDERHAKIMFPLEDIAAQLDRLQVLYANIDSSRQEIQTVNLLVQRNVPVTFVPPPEPEADAADPDATASPSPAVAQGSPAAVTKKNLSTKKITVKRAVALHGASHHDKGVRRAIPVSAGGGQ
jgi:cell division protein FtsQ